jgi:hypothetical protein
MNLVQRHLAWLSHHDNVLRVHLPNKHGRKPTEHQSAYWLTPLAWTVYCLQGDITAGKMIFGVEGVDPARRRQLVQLLDIDLYQRLTTMSDGQRRRVQICMGLLKPYDVSGVQRWCAAVAVLCLDGWHCHEVLDCACDIKHLSD